MLSELLGAMSEGKQITNGPQSMCKLPSGRFLLFCDTAGCCDSEMTDEEVKNYLDSDDAEWVIAHNTLLTGASASGLTGG